MLVKQNDTAYLVMTDGHIVQRDAKNAEPRIITFTNYAVDLANFESSRRSTRYKARELYTQRAVKP